MIIEKLMWVLAAGTMISSTLQAAAMVGDLRHRRANGRTVRP